MEHSVMLEIRSAIVMGAAAFAAMLQAGWANAQEPQRTTATYGAWELRCENRMLIAGADPARTCEIGHGVQLQGQPQPVAQMVVGRGGAGEPLRIVFQVPIGVWLPTTPTFQANDGAVPARAAYKRCLPQACLADIIAVDEIVALMRDDAGEGKLVFEAAEGRPTAIPISYVGFGAALDALAAAEKQ